MVCSQSKRCGIPGRIMRKISIYTVKNIFQTGIKWEISAYTGIASKKVPLPFNTIPAVREGRRD